AARFAKSFASIGAPDRSAMAAGPLPMVTMVAPLLLRLLLLVPVLLGPLRRLDPAGRAEVAGGPDRDLRRGAARVAMAFVGGGAGQKGVRHREAAVAARVVELDEAAVAVFRDERFEGREIQVGAVAADALETRVNGG